MRKAVLKICILVLTLLVCINGNSISRADDEPIRIVVWSFTNELQGMIEKYYVPNHPEIEFVFHIYPTDGNIYTTKLDNMFSNKPTSSDAPDVFALDASFVKKYVNSNVTGDIHDIGLTDNEMSVSYPSSAMVGQTTEGVQKALSWQTTSGVLVYRASLAEKYLDVKTPEEMQEKVKDWDSFLETAEELKNASEGACKIVTGTGDIWNAYQNQRSQGWVAEDNLIIGSELFNYEQLCRTLERDDLTQKGSAWSEVWFAGMRGENETLCYFLPTWGLHYTLMPNCVAGWDAENPDSEANIRNATENGTYGDWRIVIGPSSYTWGGTWIATNAAKVNAADDAKKAAIGDLFYFLTLDEDFQTQYAADTGDFVNNSAAVQNIIENGGTPNPFLGGQDHTSVFAEAAVLANGALMSEYDDIINNLWRDYVTIPYSKGEKDLDACLEDFKAAFASRFPNYNIIEYPWNGVIAQGNCGGNAIWTLNLEGTLTISGSGAIDDDNEDPYRFWHGKQNKIYRIVVEDGITRIGDYAFAYCRQATSITIPDSVTSIGMGAFMNTAITNIDLSQNIEEIGAYAFYDCDNLKNITIPENITTINDNLFTYCKSLESVVLPSNLQVISANAFKSCISLARVVLPGSVSALGDNAFSYCTGLTSITLSHNLISIGERAFKGCSSITEIILPDSLISIGAESFAGCNSITEVMVPGQCKLGSGAFSNCCSLNSIFVATSNRYYASQNGILFSKNMKTLIQYPAGKTAFFYVIPKGIISIGNNAFSQDGTIKEIVIPEDVVIIGEEAFWKCSNLEKITLPSSLYSIGKSAFYDNVSLTKINYYGTEDDRYMISIASGNNSLEEAEWNYCSGDIIVSNGSCGENLTWALANTGTLTISGSGAMYNYDGEEILPWYDYRDEITAVVIEDGATSIGNYAFYYFYDKLESVIMADSVTQIGDAAFQYCTALKNVQLSSGLTEIGSYAFAQDVLITTVALPDGLKTLGMAAFADSGLTSIVIPSGIATTTWDFFYTGSDGKLHPYHITLPASVKDAGYGTFYHTSLPYDTPDFVVPSGITVIGSEAFYGINPRFVWLPESVKTIGSSAFAGCTNLRYVYIPNGCDTIEPYAFPEGTVILGISGYDESGAAQVYADTHGYKYVELEDPFGGNG